MKSFRVIPVALFSLLYILLPVLSQNIKEVPKTRLRTDDNKISERFIEEPDEEKRKLHLLHRRVEDCQKE